MKYPYSTQIIAIQKVRTLLSSLTSLMQDEKWEGINDIMNDCGSTIAALNLSDPYKEIERLQNQIVELKKHLAHYADVNQNQ